MTPQRATSPKTILLVDDDSTVVKALAKALSRKGYEVLTAETLEEAVRAAKRSPEIHLLVVDAVMPKMSGPELAEVLLFLNPKMKVMFITGLDCLTMRLAFDRACSVLQKPFSTSNLVSKVQELLEEPSQQPQAAPQK